MTIAVLLHVQPAQNDAKKPVVMTKPSHEFVMHSTHTLVSAVLFTLSMLLTSPNEVGGNQHPRLASPEVVYSSSACAVGLVARDGVHVDTLVHQLPMQRLRQQQQQQQ
jgi:hypothetical protein